MKVEYLTSACVVVEHDGIRVLCDPWLTDGVYYARRSRSTCPTRRRGGAMPRRSSQP